MYGYNEVVFSMDDVLKRVSQEEIYEFIVGYKPEAHKYVISPVKSNDTKPGAWYEWWNGKLYFVDFGDPEGRVNRDCFQMLMDMQGIPLQTAVKMINDHFQLNNRPVIYPDIVSTFKSKKASNRDIISKQERLPTEITFKSRMFDDRDKKFWYNRFRINKPELMEDNVFAVIWYKFFSQKKKEWIVIRPDDICYAFNDFKDGRVKLYRPLIKTPIGKWITNCDQNDIGGIDRLPPTGRQLVVKKSYKDGRVLKNEGATTCWLQNEGMIPDNDILIPLCARFDDVPVFFDNDETGQKAAIKVVERINSFLPGRARPIWLPTIYPKDPSEMLDHNLQRELQQFLTTSNIVHNGNLTIKNTPIMGAPFDTTLSE